MEVSRNDFMNNVKNKYKLASAGLKLVSPEKKACVLTTDLVNYWLKLWNYESGKIHYIPDEWSAISGVDELLED